MYQEEELEVSDVHRGMFVLELANACMAELKANDPEEERQRFIGTLMCAGEHIYEQLGPGEWEAFDADVWSKQIVARNAKELAEMYFDITSFFGWMAVCGLMTASSVIGIIKDLERVGPRCPACSELVQTTLELLSKVPIA